MKRFALLAVGLVVPQLHVGNSFRQLSSDNHAALSIVQLVTCRSKRPSQRHKHSRVAQDPDTTALYTILVYNPYMYLVRVAKFEMLSHGPRLNGAHV